MTAFVALLRAVNVGGTNKLAMADLKRLGEDAGFASVRTYIASGNLLFQSDAGEAAVKAALEDRLAAHIGKRVPVLVRSQAEMAAVARDNPFPDDPLNRTVAIFLDRPPPPDAVERACRIEDEKLALGRREIYVAYGSGMARSKLQIPAGANGTARNMNTVARLAELAAAL